jgi:hypothetical protein
LLSQKTNDNVLFSVGRVGGLVPVERAARARAVDDAQN